MAAKDYADEAVRLHRHYRGKVQTALKVPVEDFSDFSLWYTPGVAAACRAIIADPEEVWVQTNRANRVAIVSDGTRILGLGDIGPKAGLPVMEGKALLFKYLGGVDAVPLCLQTESEDALVEAVLALEPSFGGVNLEDIAQPKCFRVLERLRKSSTIPVWHDDQQGTATVVIAGLLNALRVVGKTIGDVRIVLVGVGAANYSTYRLLPAIGADLTRVVACDRGGTLHPGRTDIEARQDEFPEKWRVCTESNASRLRGGIAEALRGADVCLAFSEPVEGTLRPEWIASMARDPIVFSCANPVPEIWPKIAREAGARVVATGRSDFPNQVNNSLGFPAIFRGALDVRARAITDEMTIAAAEAMSACAREHGLDEQHILPRMDDRELIRRVALAVAEKAIAQGVALQPRDPRVLGTEIDARVAAARRATAVWIAENVIPPRP